MVIPKVGLSSIRVSHNKMTVVMVSAKTECFVPMNRGWVVRLALRVAIRSQRDRCHQFLRFMESSEGVAITHWHTELFKCRRHPELCDLHNRQKLGLIPTIT